MPKRDVSATQLAEINLELKGKLLPINKVELGFVAHGYLNLTSETLLLLMKQKN